MHDAIDGQLTRKTTMTSKTRMKERTLAQISTTTADPSLATLTGSAKGATGLFRIAAN